MKATAGDAEKRGSAVPRGSAKRLSTQRDDEGFCSEAMHNGAMSKLLEEALTNSIIGGFFAVYNGLGFGLSERIYVLGLEQELKARGHDVAIEVSVPVVYRSVLLQEQRLDVLVDEKVILEVKATAVLHPSATQQLFNYLRLTTYQVGLLLHFGPEPSFALMIHSDKGKQA
jgi:GxxExxY protein